ncbi:MAG: patatin-like phospholipase family protein [Gemmataceae bacterium]
MKTILSFSAGVAPPTGNLGPTVKLVMAVAVVVAWLGAGCSTPRQDAVPSNVAAAYPAVDLNNCGEYRPLPPEFFRKLMDGSSTTESRLTRASESRLQVLALSGGGKFGAYSAGVLNGWTRSGQRPTFDVVTGVSTGALVATYALLGPRYDDRARVLYTTLTTRDVIRRRPAYGMLGGESAYSSDPLASLIDQEVTDQLLAEVRCAHAGGRRLFVATTNLDTSRPVVWDMGAIAASQRPDRREHFRDVLLASASVPGAMPPVRIPVTFNGCRYVELHGDGGATQELFLRGTMLGIDPATVSPGRRPLTGSDLYIIVAGKLYADPQVVEPKTLKLGGAAAASVLFAQTRNDLSRLYTLSAVSGMRFHMVALPADFPVSGNSLEFDPAEMCRLFQAGYRDGLRQAWRSTPPETEPAEQVIPRKGTDFYTPVVPQP